MKPSPKRLQETAFDMKRPTKEFPQCTTVRTMQQIIQTGWSLMEVQKEHKCTQCNYSAIPQCSGIVWREVTSVQSAKLYINFIQHINGSFQHIWAPRKLWSMAKTLFVLSIMNFLWSKYCDTSVYVINTTVWCLGLGCLLWPWPDNKENYTERSICNSCDVCCLVKMPAQISSTVVRQFWCNSFSHFNRHTHSKAATVWNRQTDFVWFLHIRFC